MASFVGRSTFGVSELLQLGLAGSSGLFGTVGEICIVTASDTLSDVAVEAVILDTTASFSLTDLDFWGRLSCVFNRALLLSKGFSLKGSACGVGTSISTFL